jgi:hypothetical protein
MRLDLGVRWGHDPGAAGLRRREGWRSSVEMIVGIALVIVAALLIVGIMRTVIANAPR